MYPERGTVLIDAGSRALGKDTLERPDASPWAAIVGHPQLSLRAISQEVGILSGPEDALSQLRIGQQLQLLPNHSCLTATNFNEYYVVDESLRVLGALTPVPRGF